jgi:hypothetical protein
MAIIWNEKVQRQQMTSLETYQQKWSTTVKGKVAKDRGAYKTSASGSVAGRSSCPEQTADDKEDHTDNCLARVYNSATTKMVGG